MKKEKKMQVFANNILDVADVLGHEKRRKIIEILVDKGPKNITELQEELGIRSYKNAHNHVNKLLKIGFIETKHVPYKEGVKLETSKELVSNVLNEKVGFDLRSMFYFPVSHEKFNEFIEDKKAVTENDIKKRFPAIKKDMLRWYLLLFGINYHIKISHNGRKVEDKR